ncbi:hypothetical protein ACFQ9X_17215 [Catenulispora yoronensis]
MTAERDRRAGDRAGRDRARDNAAGLRRPAGQISALTGLPAARPAAWPRCATPLAPATPPI